MLGDEYNPLDSEPVVALQELESRLLLAQSLGTAGTAAVLSPLHDAVQGGQS